MNVPAEGDGRRPSYGSRQSSFVTASATGANPGMSKVSSRFANGSLSASGGHALYDPGRESFDASSGRYIESLSDRGDESRWGGSDYHTHSEHESEQNVLGR